MIIRSLSAVILAAALSTPSFGYTVTRFEAGAHPAANTPTTCSGLGRICKSMGASGGDDYVASCKATGTWNSRSLTVTGVPKR